jgi:DNA-directed RNA polymerase
MSQNTKITTINDSCNEESTLLQTQLKIEMSMRDEGVTKMLSKNNESRKKNVESNTEYGHTLLVQGLERFTTGVTEWLESPVKVGRGARVHRKLLGGDPQVISFIFMKYIINGISKKNMMLQTILKNAVRQVEDEFRLKQLRADDKQLCKRLIDAHNKRQGKAKRLSLISGMVDEASKGNIQAWEDWDNNAVLQIGSKLLTILMETVGLVKIVTESKGKRNTVKRLLATQETLDWISKRGEQGGLTSPMYKPLVIQPRDWNSSNLTNGVYYTRHNRAVKFVKTNNKAYFDELKHCDIDLLMYSVNAMQKTAWTVNKPILKLMTEMKELGIEWCPSLPSGVKELPPTPLQNFDEATIEEKAAFAQERNRIDVGNRVMDSKSFAFNSFLATAAEFSQYDEFYFGYQLDFRGRVYSVSSYNCMGPDEMKATLQFAKGKPLGEDGWKWLAIHLANVGDFDKISKAPFEERVQWVMDNENWIMDCVVNPWDNRKWVDADKPFLFMAAAMEWKGFLEQGDSFVSHVSASMDGSCSGLQHLAMAMKCSTTAKSVNITPSEQPEDVYQIVADKVVKSLIEDSQQSFEHWGEPVLNNMGVRVPNYTELALEWLKYGFGRKEAKRSTMCYSYGSKQYGFRTQIIEDVMRPLKRKCNQKGIEFPFSYDDGYRASNYIARHLWVAVVDTVKRPAMLMEWLAAVASQVAKTKFIMRDGSKQTMPVRWTTPLGLPVVQAYYNMESHRVKTNINGSLVFMTMSKETDQICSRQSSQSMSPNWVHSCDAAHLQLSVARAKEEGIDSFMLIHDSFGTHCADTGRFGAIIREAMVEMYETSDVVHDLYLELRAQLLPEDMEDFPLPPGKGSLDRSASLESRYSFA